MNMKCLADLAKEGGLSQDNFYHSLLGLLDANTSFYNERHDLFSRCRKWNRKPK